MTPSKIDGYPSFTRNDGAAIINNDDKDFREAVARKKRFKQELELFTRVSNLEKGLGEIRAMLEVLVSAINTKNG